MTMKGIPFQPEIIMMAIKALTESFSTEPFPEIPSILKIPCIGPTSPSSKNRHPKPKTTNGVTHGKRMSADAVRDTDDSRLKSSAIGTPRNSSTKTVPIVQIQVRPNAAQREAS